MTTPRSHLAALTAFLADPASYPHRPASVRLVQTHISIVAIASPHVYKVKKPVDFGFLDFTTLALRKRYCEEEVRVNRRLCARIYEGVTPICRQSGRLHWGGDGDIVDYAVTMRELDARYFLHEMLQAGTLSRGHIDRVVDALVPFYRNAGTSPEIAAWGRVEALRVSTDENFEQTNAFAGRLLSLPAYHAIRHLTDAFYIRHAGLLERRRQEGRIVDGHGDLRLEHIHDGPNGLCIYDAIEFSDRLRAVDVASDIAFLAMDLDFNGRHDLARAFTDAMARALDDPGIHAVIDFYCGYRAYVRAKVESMRSDEPEVPEAEREASRERARRYYSLALRYAAIGARPAVVVVMGRIGAGKSTLAQGLGAALGWEVASSDRIRKEQAGLPLFERGDADVRRWLYAPERTERVYDALCEWALERAGAGLGTVLDATYSKASARRALRQALAEAGAPFILIEVAASDADIQARLAKRADEPGVVSDARLEDYVTLSAGYEPPADDEADRFLRVEARTDPETTLEEALIRLGDG